MNTICENAMTEKETEKANPQYQNLPDGKTGNYPPDDEVSSSLMSDPVRLYMREIGQTDLLNADDEF